MRSLLHVRQRGTPVLDQPPNKPMSVNQMFKSLSISTATISAAICFELLGEIRGFVLGFDAAIYVENPDLSGINFTSHGPNLFEVIGNAYLVLGFLFLLYIVGQILREKALSQALVFISLAGVALQFFLLLTFKFGVLKDSAEIHNTHYDWLKHSVPFDWICVSISVSLIIGHTVRFAIRRYHKPTL